MHADVIGDNVPRCPVRLRLSSLSAVRGQSEDSIAVVPLLRDCDGPPAASACKRRGTLGVVNVCVALQLPHLCESFDELLLPHRQMFNGPPLGLEDSLG